MADKTRGERQAEREAILALADEIRQAIERSRVSMKDAFCAVDIASKLLVKSYSTDSSYDSTPLEDK